MGKVQFSNSHGKQVAEIWFILPSSLYVWEIWTKKILEGDKLAAVGYYGQIKISVVCI